jgi:hypothetical protein
MNRTWREDSDVGVRFGLRSQPDPKVVEKLRKRSGYVTDQGELADGSRLPSGNRHYLCLS